MCVCVCVRRDDMCMSNILIAKTTYAPVNIYTYRHVHTHAHTYLQRLCLAYEDCVAPSSCSYNQHWEYLAFKLESNTDFRATGYIHIFQAQVGPSFFFSSSEFVLAYVYISTRISSGRVNKFICVHLDGALVSTHVPRRGA